MQMGTYVEYYVMQQRMESLWQRMYVAITYAT